MINDENERRPSAPCDAGWVDGRLVSQAPDEAESFRALAQGRGCYTTSLFENGRIRWSRRHGERIARDSRALGLGRVDAAVVEKALDQLGRACFEGGSGIVRFLVVRLQDSSAEAERLELRADARDLGADPALWQALRAPFPHEASGPWTGAKGSNHPLYERARSIMTDNSMDEMVMIDSEGYAIEGCRSNLFVVDGAGHLVAPNISRGAVAGLAQEIVHERIPEIVVRDMPEAELAEAAELIAVNSVRRARPVVRLDGTAVGSGEPGPWCARVDEVLQSEA